MKVEIKLTGVDGILKTLQSLPPEIVSKRGGPVKLALAKGARLIRDEARKNLRASAGSDGDYQATQLLEKSVIASRGKAPLSGKGERYLVRVKRKSYPKLRGKKATTTLQTANLKEYGSSTQPAEPWLRPAVNTKASQAITVITEDLVKRVNDVVKNLASQNQGK